MVAATNVMMDMGAEIPTQKIDDTVPLVGTVADGAPAPHRQHQHGQYPGGFDTFIMPGIVVLILQQQCIILVIGMAGGAKRERRTLVRYDADNYEPSIFRHHVRPDAGLHHHPDSSGGVHDPLCAAHLLSFPIAGKHV